MTLDALHAFAHDARRYLRTALTRTELAQSSSVEALPDKQRQFLKEAAVSLTELDNLLLSFLTYAEAQNGRSASPMPLELIVRGILTEARKRFDEAGGQVVIDGVIPPTQVSGSLRFVIRELLENAVKFRRGDPPRAVIAFRTGEDWVEFDVSDNGIGIEPQYTEDIFQPFKRLHSNAEYRGFGLGLATSRALVTALEGKLFVESEPGRGSIFRCRVPVAPSN